MTHAGGPYAGAPYAGPSMVEDTTPDPGGETYSYAGGPYAGFAYAGPSLVEAASSGGGGDVTGTLTLALPLPSLTLSGTALPPPVTGTLDLTSPIPVLTLDGAATAPPTGTLDLTLPVPQISMAGTVVPPAVNGTLTLGLPLPTLAMYDGSADAVGTLDLTLPLPTLEVFGTLPGRVTTLSVDRGNGRRRSGRGRVTFETPLAIDTTATPGDITAVGAGTGGTVGTGLIPADLVQLQTVAVAISDPVFDALGQPQPGWGDDRTVVYGDAWADSLHLVVNGRDMTKVQGQVVDVLTWPSLSEGGFWDGPAVFRFPGVPRRQYRTNPADMPAHLRALTMDASVKLVPALAGVRQDALWHGEITKFTFTDGTLVAHCAGQAAARFNNTQRQPRLFHKRKDGGVMLFDLFRAHNLTMKPHLGLTTGITLDAKGSGEGSLEYGQSLLADLTHANGDTYVIERRATGRGFRMVEKDTTTVHYTIFDGTDGVSTDGLERDGYEEVNTMYGSGQDPDGRVWFNGVYPGLLQGEPPDFPGVFGEGATDADLGDPDEELLTGFIWKLVTSGLLRRKDTPGGYDGDVVEAVEKLQRRAHLPVTGVVNLATWKALYSLEVTGYHVSGALVMPLAQLDAAREWDRDPQGNILRRNPDWDGRRVKSRTVEHGMIRQERAEKWSDGVIARAQRVNWVGPIELSGVDVFEGDVTLATAGAASLVSRHRVLPNRNIKVVGFDGDIVTHIAATQPRDLRTVVLTTDTQARDLPEIGAVMARKRAASLNRGRVWKEAHGTTGATRDGRIPFSEIGGILGDRIRIRKGWNEFFVVGGDEGNVGKMRLRIPGVEYAVAVFGERPGVGWLTKNVPNPFGKDADGNTLWLAEEVQERLYNQRTLLHAYGTDEEPAGYGYKLHSKVDDATGDTVNTGAPLTGLYVNDTGFPYICIGQPLIWVAVFSRGESHVRPGRILWNAMAEVG